MDKQRVAIVLNMHPTGYGVMRDLAVEGIPVVGLDCDARKSGFYSRYGDKMLCPTPEDKRDLLEFLLRVAGRYNHKPILFPANDRYAFFIAEHQDELAPCYELPIPALSTVECFLDKGRIAEEMRTLGIAEPGTIVLRNETELRNQLSRIRFPRVVKPTPSHKGLRGAWQVNNKEELRKRSMAAFSGGQHVIVQELIPGGTRDLWLYCAYYNRSSEPKVFFTCRKVREYPVRYGTACMAETVRNPVVKDLAEKILKHFSYIGLVGAEFKWDSTDGVYKVIEINPRTVLFHSIGTVAGANLTVAAYRDMAGIPHTSDGTFVEGRKWWFIRRDIESAVNLLRSGELTVTDWLRSMRGKKARALFSWRDMAPFVLSLPYVGRLRGTAIRPRLSHEGPASDRQTEDDKGDA